MAIKAMGSVKGFTLIELIAVIVILGIVAGVAIPKFIDLTNAAEDASVKSIAGALGSGSAINYSTYIILSEKSGSLSGVVSPVPIESCADATSLLEHDFPGDYSLEASSGASASVADMSTTSCDVVSDQDSTIRASFILHGVNPSSPP